MPYRIDKVGDVYKLWNIDKKEYVKRFFKARASATNAGKQYIKFREKRKAKVVDGRYIVPID